jgi:GH24 family phage-related lysozyme (muramidase)
MAGQILDVQFPEINPTGAPEGDYERIPSSPSSFGAFGAEALKQTGEGLVKAADTGLSYLTEQNQYNNQIHASELHSWFSDQAGDLVSKHSELQGRAALDALPDLKKKIGDLQTQAESQAGNLPTKALVAGNTRRTMDWLVGAATHHADAQHTAWATKTAADNVVAASNIGGLAIQTGDFNKLDEQMDVIGKEAHNYFDPMGYDPQTLDVEVSKYRGSALKNWVETAATNQNDPDALTHAVSIYHRYEQDIDPASRLTISKELNTKVFSRTVDRLSNYYISGSVAGLNPSFVAGLKQSEGFKETPYWDVNHWSVGYGTPASGPNEKADRFELEGRFEDKVTEAASVVDSVNPHLDPGTRAALTSLTFNTGQKWVNSGLGDAIRSGDLMKAQELFKQYNQVAGKFDQSIADRRNREAEWFGRQDAQDVPKPDVASLIQRVRTDPSFANRPELQKAVEQNILSKTAMQERADALQAKQQKETSDATEWEVFKNIHSDKPTVTMDMIDKLPLTVEAKKRMAEQLDKMTGSNEKAEKTYGNGFYDMYRRIHLPEGDPDRITDGGQLYGHVGPQGDLTVAGVDKLNTEIQARKSPEGVAESEMKAQFLKNARAQITGTDEGLHIKDPKGDELYLKFLAQVLPQYDAQRKAGKSAPELFNPESPDYLGKAIAGFRRPMDQWYADTIHDQATPATFDVTKVKSLDDLVAAYRAGNVDKATADATAIAHGWATRKPPPPQMPTLPMSQ